jgi:hypothetical protein
LLVQRNETKKGPFYEEFFAIAKTALKTLFHFVSKELLIAILRKSIFQSSLTQLENTDLQTMGN